MLMCDKRERFVNETNNSKKIEIAKLVDIYYISTKVVFYKML